MTTTFELQGQLVVQLETKLETKLKLGPGIRLLKQAGALLDEPACGHLFVGPVENVPLAQTLASLAELCLLLAEQEAVQKKEDDAAAVAGETSLEVYVANTALVVSNTARWASFAHSGGPVGVALWPESVG